MSLGGSGIVSGCQGVLRGVFFCGTSSKTLQIKSQKGAAAARSRSEVVCSGSLACKCKKRGGGKGAISPRADPNRNRGGVGDDTRSPASAHSSWPNTARSAQRPGVAR